MRSWILTLALAIPLAGATVTYSYDEAGRLSRVDYGDGKTITYTYDKAGNLLSRVITAPESASESAKAAGDKTRSKESSRKTAPRQRR